MLSAAPFYYAAQREHATRLLTIPYSDFNTLALGLPDPPLNLLYSVGRCGSTLLSNALRQLEEVVTLSEPDVYTHVVGMREPDGSRDAELIALLRSATRFLCSSTQAKWFIKFRGSCIEIADLMAEAFPEAEALFLYRDLKGWSQSMERLIRVREEERQEREAHSPAQAARMSYSRYPRDRYTSLLRQVASPPETRAESIAFNWASLVLRYLSHHRAGIIHHALNYTTLTTLPEASLEAVMRVYNLPCHDLTGALGSFEQDSQQGTKLSRAALRRGKDDEPRPSDFEAAEAIITGYGLEADPYLPGDLFEPPNTR